MPFDFRGRAATELMFYQGVTSGAAGRLWYPQELCDEVEEALRNGTEEQCAEVVSRLRRYAAHIQIPFSEPTANRATESDAAQTQLRAEIAKSVWFKLSSAEQQLLIKLAQSSRPLLGREWVNVPKDRKLGGAFYRNSRRLIRFGLVHGGGRGCGSRGYEATDEGRKLVIQFAQQSDERNCRPR